jgi:hypothetical protein
VLPRLEYTGTRQRILDQALEVEEISEQPQPLKKLREPPLLPTTKANPPAGATPFRPSPPRRKPKPPTRKSPPLAQPAASVAARPEISTIPQATVNKKQTITEANDQSEPAAASLSGDLAPV